MMLLALDGGTPRMNLVTSAAAAAGGAAAAASVAAGFVAAVGD